MDEPSGAPLLLLLESGQHWDLPNLPDERAAELGRLIVHIARAVDGGEHMHRFVYARPAGFSQLRGTCFPL